MGTSAVRVEGLATRLARAKRRLQRHPWRFLGIVVRLALAALFLVSGVQKLADPSAFGVIIEAFGLLPESLVVPVSLALPLLEIVAATGLVFNRAGSLELTTALLLIFLAVLAWGIHLGLDVDCGCFGPGDPEAEAFHGLRSALYRDMGLMAAIVFLFVQRQRRRA